MAINITCAGKVYNDGSAIVANYVGYVIRGSTLVKKSNVRVCESDGAYNFNIGAADWLGQDGTILNGDIIMVAAWLGDINAVETAAYIKNTYSTTKDVYVTDIELIDVPQIECSRLALVPSNPQLTDTLRVTIPTPLNLTAVIGTYTSYLSAYFNGVSIFPGIDVSFANSTFNWGDGTSGLNLFQHVYPTAGHKTLTINAVNGYNNRTLTCSKAFGVIRGAPSGCLLYTPSTIYMHDTVTISSCINDDAVTKVEYYVEDVLKKTVVGNDQSSAVFDYTVDVYRPYYNLKQKIFYFDGIAEQYVWYTRQMPLANSAPEVSISFTNTDCTYHYSSIITDFENEAITCKYDILYLTPMDNAYKTIYYGTYSDSTTLDVTYNHPGKYKIICYGKDASGNIGTSFVELETTCGCTGSECPECPDVETKYIYVTNHEVVLNTDETTININNEEEFNVYVEIQAIDVKLEQSDIQGVINGSNTNIRTY